MEFTADLTITADHGRQLHLRSDAQHNLVVQFADRSMFRQWLQGQTSGTARSLRQLQAINDVLNRTGGRVRLRVGNRELLRLGQGRPRWRYLDLIPYLAERSVTRRPRTAAALAFFIFISIIWLTFGKERK